MLSNQRIRTILVDDELLAREYLRDLLRSDTDIEIVGECIDGPETVVAIRELNPELVFLDIQMPGMDGFEVIQSIGVDTMPAVVFVTAFDQYALKAFETHAVDYLVKPFDMARLKHALTHIKQEILLHREDKGLAFRLSAMVEEHQAQLLQNTRSIRTQKTEWLTRLPIKSVERSYLVRAEDIVWVEAADSYVNIRSDGKSHLLRESMKWLEVHLDPKKFLRIHRKIIINIDKIKELRAGVGGDFSVLMDDGKQVPLSRRRRKNLEKLLGRGI